MQSCIMPGLHAYLVQELHIDTAQFTIQASRVAIYLLPQLGLAIISSEHVGRLLITAFTRIKIPDEPHNLYST